MFVELEMICNERRGRRKKNFSLITHSRLTEFQSTESFSMKIIILIER